MREAFVHEAVLDMGPDADTRAPGAAITVALCGHWEHEPPCPLAPHHTSVNRAGTDVHVRTLFVVEPGREDEVHGLIDAALAESQLVGPDGELTRWRFRCGHPSPVLPHEADHARRLATS